MRAEAHEGRDSAEGQLLAPARDLELLPRKASGLSLRWVPKPRDMGQETP